MSTKLVPIEAFHMMQPRGPVRSGDAMQQPTVRVEVTQFSAPASRPSPRAADKRNIAAASPVARSVPPAAGHKPDPRVMALGDNLARFAAGLVLPRSAPVAPAAEEKRDRLVAALGESLARFAVGLAVPAYRQTINQN